MSTPKWKKHRKELLEQGKIIVIDGIEMYDTPFGKMCINPNDFILVMAKNAEKENFYGKSIQEANF